MYIILLVLAVCNGNCNLFIFNLIHLQVAMYCVSSLKYELSELFIYYYQYVYLNWSRTSNRKIYCLYNALQVLIFNSELRTQKYIQYIFGSSFTIIIKYTKKT